jgi:hypothetical protein
MSTWGQYNIKCIWIIKNLKKIIKNYMKVIKNIQGNKYKLSTKYKTNRNALNSCNALWTKKHDGFQCGMCDNILSFNVFNHSILSLLIMIHTKGTLMRWSSNPIKVNKWNFMSFVPNVTSIKMAPLWPYGRMDSHWVAEWDLSLTDFTNILQKEHIFQMLENPKLNLNCKIGV